MNRKVFFDDVRASVFGGKITKRQVEGTEAILNEWQARGLKDLRWLAYMLATAFHETAHTMQPIREYGRGRGRAYGKRDPETGQQFYGRGYVQVTWKANYAKASKKLKLDLVGKPDLALRPDIAAAILFDGMIEGWFTGRKLSGYFNQGTSDWRGARRIVNGTDRAALIASYGREFHDALRKAA